MEKLPAERGNDKNMRDSYCEPDLKEYRARVCVEKDLSSADLFTNNDTLSFHNFVYLVQNAIKESCAGCTSSRKIFVKSVDIAKVYSTLPVDTYLEVEFGNTKRPELGKCYTIKHSLDSKDQKQQQQQIMAYDVLVPHSSDSKRITVDGVTSVHISNMSSKYELPICLDGKDLDTHKKEISHTRIETTIPIGNPLVKFFRRKNAERKLEKTAEGGRDVAKMNQILFDESWTEMEQFVMQDAHDTSAWSFRLKTAHNSFAAAMQSRGFQNESEQRYSIQVEISLIFFMLNNYDNNCCPGEDNSTGSHMNGNAKGFQMQNSPNYNQSRQQPMTADGSPGQRPYNPQYSLPGQKSRDAWRKN